MGKYRRRKTVIPDFHSSTIPYVLGVLYGDAGVYKDGAHRRVILGVTDRVFAQSFSDALKKMGLNPHISEYAPPNSNRQKIYFVRACSIIFYEWFKSVTLNEVEQIVSKSKRATMDFVRGFYESEGSYSPPTSRCNYSQCRMCNTNLKLLSLVKRLVSRLGFKSKIYPRRKDSYAPRFDLHIRGGHSENQKFLSLIKPCIKM